jgi:ubiquinone/menaquinone biosynthesis C-methylase UbiE
MYIKLDQQVEQLLCCSLCKEDLLKEPDKFICKSCGLIFPKRLTNTGNNQKEFVYDFRIHHPNYCIPQGHEQWEEAQFEYEKYHDNHSTSDSLKEYIDEIESVREIYATEYPIKGRVLDVGGHQGRLRHFLGNDVSLFVSIDPYIEIFSDISRQENLLQVYPCLSEPCNFIAAHAEYLPFKSRSFDWIHMRSVVDHFADPYLAFLEAFRCATVGGKLLVGLSIIDKMNSPKNQGETSLGRNSILSRIINKLKRDGLLGLLQAVMRKTRHSIKSKEEDDHMFRLTHDNLINLYNTTGWNVVKEHWQKPPFQYCIYACGQKIEISSLNEKDNQ